MTQIWTSVQTPAPTHARTSVWTQKEGSTASVASAPDLHLTSILVQVNRILLRSHLLPCAAGMKQYLCLCVCLSVCQPKILSVCLSVCLLAKSIHEYTPATSSLTSSFLLSSILSLSLSKPCSSKYRGGGRHLRENLSTCSTRIWRYQSDCRTKSRKHRIIFVGGCSLLC